MLGEIGVASAAAARFASNMSVSAAGWPIRPGMRRAEASRWNSAIRNASNGKVYPADIQLKSGDILHAARCVLGFLCAGQDWTRVEALADRSNPLQPDYSPVQTLLARTNNLLDCAARQTKPS
jgi:hypothetical protein